MRRGEDFQVIGEMRIRDGKRSLTGRKEVSGSGLGDGDAGLGKGNSGNSAGELYQGMTIVGLKMNGRKCNGGKWEDGREWGAERGGEDGDDGGAAVRRWRRPEAAAAA